MNRHVNQATLPSRLMSKVWRFVRQENLQRGVDAALLPLSLFLAFGSALVVSYGHSDDYSVLFLKQIGWEQMNIDWFLASGRPILGFLIDWLLDWVDSVDGLARLRTVGFLLLLWLGWEIRRLLLNSRLPRHEATFLASACVLTPSAAVFVGWAVTSASMLAGIVALLAYRTAERAWRDWGAHREENMGKVRVVAWLGLAAAALLSAFLIYQPLAPLFLLAALLRFAFDQEAERPQRRLLAMLAGYIIVMAVYLAIYKMFIVPALAGNPALERGGLDHSAMAAAKHLIKTLPMLWGGWEFFLSGIHPEGLPRQVRLTVTMLAVALLLPVGLWHIAGKRGGGVMRRISAIFLVLLVWLVSLLPMLILKEHYLPTRTLFFSYAALCLLIYLAFKALTKDHIWPRWTTMGVLFLLAAQAGLGFWDGIVRIQRQEFAVLRNAINAMPERPKKLVFIQPDHSLAPDHQLRTYYEYYIYSSDHDWVPNPIVNLIWNQREGIGMGHADGARLVYTEVERIRPGQLLPIKYDAVLDTQLLLCGVPGR
ncbi:MAG: hypothetical protein GC183_05870 [Thiobacillus sp.]|nr:hypothetical protein [Thiobacillus sp.]